MRPTVTPTGNGHLGGTAHRNAPGSWTRRLARLVRVGRWRARWSRGTAGRSRSARASRSACTCRRRAGGRCGSRWHGSARGREVVFSSDAVAADEHETPTDASSKGCGWPVALTLDVESDVAVGLLRGRHGDRRRRQGAARLRLLRRASASGTRDRAGAGDQHVARLQRLRRTEPLHRRAPTSPCSGRWRRATSTSRRARAAG